MAQVNSHLRYPCKILLEGQWSLCLKLQVEAHEKILQMIQTQFEQQKASKDARGPRYGRQRGRRRCRNRWAGCRIGIAGREQQIDLIPVQPPSLTQQTSRKNGEKNVRSNITNCVNANECINFIVVISKGEQGVRVENTRTSILTLLHLPQIHFFPCQQEWIQGTWHPVLSFITLIIPQLSLKPSVIPFIELLAHSASLAKPAHWPFHVCHLALLLGKGPVRE
jgi:hypothetical protein